jgi:hypothetical protein
LFFLPGGAENFRKRFKTPEEVRETSPKVPAHARILFLDAGVNLIELDPNALGQTHALDYQIRSLDAHGKTFFTSLLEPLSLDSTAYVFDIDDHSQN